MGYYVSSMIGIRTSGVFGGEPDMEDTKARILKVWKAGEDGEPIWGNAKDAEWINWAMAPKELSATKGGLVVLAGTFNYLGFNRMGDEFGCNLSKEFGTEVMVMSWDQEQDAVQCQVYLGGKPLFEVHENPIGRILRRVE